MKTTFLTLTIILFPSLLSAQECGTGRYSTYNYFPQIDSIPGVVFGTNTAVDGTSTSCCSTYSTIRANPASYLFERRSNRSSCSSESLTTAAPTAKPL